MRATMAMPAALLLLGAAAPEAALLVAVGNVRAATGRVHVQICTRAEYLKDCRIDRAAPARVGVTTVTVAALPPGRYAAQVYYDQNGNGRVDAVAFDYAGGDKTIRLRLRYFIGPDAPR